MTYLVYVFVGDHFTLDDFMLCLQERKLLDKGDYMVISVNDEFYNPDLKSVQDNRQSECCLRLRILNFNYSLLMCLWREKILSV